MDSAQFIRKRGVFIAWLMVPLVAALLVNRAAHSFAERQSIRHTQLKKLEQITPKMVIATSDFNALTAPYKLQPAVGDVNIALLNDAAEQCGFTLTSINLSQKADEENPGTVRIDMSLKGEGSARNLAAFLRELKIRDPFIYESQILISSAVSDTSVFKIEAVLSKLYINPMEDAL